MPLPYQEPSDYLAGVFLLADSFTRASVRRVSPETDAALFLHNVTGMVDIQPTLGPRDEAVSLSAYMHLRGRTIPVTLRLTPEPIA